MGGGCKGRKRDGGELKEELRERVSVIERQRANERENLVRERERENQVRERERERILRRKENKTGERLNSELLS